MTEAEAFAKIKAALSAGGQARLVLVLKREDDGALFSEIFGQADVSQDEIAAAASALLTSGRRLPAAARAVASNN